MCFPVVVPGPKGALFTDEELIWLTDGDNSTCVALHQKPHIKQVFRYVWAFNKSNFTLNVTGSWNPLLFTVKVTTPINKVNPQDFLKQQGISHECPNVWIDEFLPLTTYNFQCKCQFDHCIFDIHLIQLNRCGQPFVSQENGITTNLCEISVI